MFLLTKQDDKSVNHITDIFVCCVDSYNMKFYHRFVLCVLPVFFSPPPCLK